MRGGRFESNLLTWPGRPKHTHGNPVPTQHFPFLSGSWIRVTHLDYKNPRPACASLYPHVAACEPSSKRVREKSTPRADQVLKLTDYHIPRHGRPNHTSRGYSQSHTCNISPFLSGLWIRVTHLDNKNPHSAWDLLYPHVAACEPSSKRVKVKSTRRADQVPKLPD